MIDSKLFRIVARVSLKYTWPAIRRGCSRRMGLLSYALFLVMLPESHAANPSSPPGKPNILWIVMDDVGAELPCYGEKKIQTPNIDRLVPHLVFWRAS